VFIRPFFSFIIAYENLITPLSNQDDKDFNMVTLNGEVELRIWETTTRDISNQYYSNRFAINGEYVVEIPEQAAIGFDFVHNLKKFIIDNNAPVQGDFNGIKYYKRHYFQNNIALEANA